MSKSLADILNLRFQYESLVTAQRPFKLKSHNSDIDSLRYFINTSITLYLPTLNKNPQWNKTPPK